MMSRGSCSERLNAEVEWLPPAWTGGLATLPSVHGRFPAPSRSLLYQNPGGIFHVYFSHSNPLFK